MTQGLTIPVEPSRSAQEAATRFLDELRAWIERVTAAYPGGFPSNSHDGWTFTTPWVVYAAATGDDAPLCFMRRCRDLAREHFETTGQWLDGYWRRQEAHHGTEHFELFLGALYALDPADHETARQADDAAEHVGNWKSGVPEWYDWERGVFRSFHLGTEFVGEPAVNVPDHLRFVGIALLAHEATGNARYLEFARAYGARWADAILARTELPAGLDADGPRYDLGESHEQYRSFAGAAPADLANDLARAENLLASGAPERMLRLWRATGEPRFRAAAERITDAAARVLDSPIAWQAQAAVGRYRRTCASDRYDAPVRALPGECFRPVREMTILPDPEKPLVIGPMGMRKDKPEWLDERGAPAPSPILWALRAAVDADEALWTRALDLGLAHFRLAARAFGDVTHHGCGSRSLCAVARGHGRLGGAGVVTELLAPALAFVT